MTINTHQQISAENTADTRLSSDDNVINDAMADVASDGFGSNTPDRLTDELANTWLDWQCKMVGGIIRGVVFRPDRLKPNGEVSSWPNDGGSEAVLIAASTQVVKTNGAVKFSKIGYGPSEKRICDIVACPLHCNDKLIAIVAVAISVRSEPQQHAVLQLLRWGGLWIESLVKHESDKAASPAAFPLQLIAAVLQQKSFHAAAIESVNQLAHFFQCERVSIGIKHGSKLRIKALSNVTMFDPRTQQVRAIEAAMIEASEQAITIVEPKNTDDETVAQRANYELSKDYGNSAICTLPLTSQDGNFGALTLERPQGQKFDTQTQSLIESLVSHLAPILDFKKRDEALLSSRGVKSKVSTVSRIFGGSHRTSLLAMLLVVVCIYAASVTNSTYEVSAPSSIESSVVQLLVAPQSGYLQEANVRAGDTVTKDQVISTLDDRTLKLDLRKKQSEHNQLEKEYLQALANGERTQLGILRAQMDQIDSDIQLTSDALLQTQMTAPFDGIVVSGDLSQSLGSPIEVGQVLFKIAPLDAYRVVLEVDEHDIDRFKVGSEGRLIVAALPQTTFTVTVEQIVPMAVAGQSNNFFQVEATLNEPTSLLRPGMRGVAKIELGERNLLWIWTHSLVDRIGLWAWSMGF